MNLIPRHRVSWRLVGSGGRKHAVLVIERGRLAWDTLCGRLSAGSTPVRDERAECGKCTAQVEPLVRARV